MAERLVTFETDGAIGIVTLRRPAKFNALDIP
ncbi:MAG: enoyl-CoA hydratase/isomerase family protein, partial [Mesorhizobium sp.]